MSLVKKLILTGSLATISYFNCAKYAKMNVYYTLDGTGKVNKSRIEIKEYKKFLWFKQEKLLLEKDSVFINPLDLKTFKSVWRSKGMVPGYVGNLD